jgi:hypothetical protein
MNARNLDHIERRQKAPLLSRNHGLRAILDVERFQDGGHMRLHGSFGKV